MCTSIVLKSKDNNYLMARTMDFSFELEPVFAVYPRKRPMQFAYFDKPMIEHYAFMGLAKNLGDYFIADGVNEHGLSGAALYFEGYATYEVEVIKNGSLSPIELVQFALATCKSIDEVKEMFGKYPVVEQKLELIGGVPPLHWTFQDANGNAIIVEKGREGLNIFDNKIGVMTNAPDYLWHLTNVRNYIGLDPKPVESRVLYGEEFKAFGQASGTYGLPGDLTSPSRFIKTLYNKLSISKAEDVDQLVVNAYHVLNGVDIPKGSVITARDTIDYTQYTSYMVNTTQTYYYRLYNSLEIKRKSLYDFDLDSEKIIILEAR